MLYFTVQATHIIKRRKERLLAKLYWDIDVKPDHPMAGTP
jgi:hypothetical protein